MKNDEYMSIISRKTKDMKLLRDEIFSLIEQTATDDCIVETCSHAMYIGEKVGK